MIPEPSSDCLPRLVSSFTTLGTTLAATCSTEPAGRLAAGSLGAAPDDDDAPSTGRSGCTRVATPPPTPADSTAIASAPTVSRPARDRRRGAAGGGGIIRVWSVVRYGSCGPR